MIWIKAFGVPGSLNTKVFGGSALITRREEPRDTGRGRPPGCRGCLLFRGPPGMRPDESSPFVRSARIWICI